MQNKTRRTVNGQQAKSDADLQAGRAALETGIQIPWQGMTLQPYAMLAGEWLERDGFDETGNTGAELSVGRSTLTSTEATVGVDVSKAFELGDTTGQLQVGVAAVQAFGDTRAEQTARFKSGSNPFSVYSANRNDTQAQLSLGAELSVGKNLSISGGYVGRFGQHGKTQAAQLQVAYR
jgi:outer membrane autotransporter protein